MRKIPMKFSDTDFGTDEYGYIPTMPGEDPDDADMRYTKHLRDQGVRARVDAMGNVVVESSAPATRAINKEKGTTMGITKSQLRRIIREEKRRLDERRSGSLTGSALIDFARAYMSLGDAVASQVDAIVEAFVNANGDADDESFVDTVFAQNSNAIDMAHDKLVRLLRFGRFGNDLGDGGDAVREALEAAKSLLDAPDEGLEAPPGPGTLPGISFPGLDD